ncbi:MAG: indole-3-glycerol phosphate synthase TrpC [Flavisolibacter sp.]
MNILDKIVEQKQDEVAYRKMHTDARSLELLPYFKRKTLSLKQFILDESRTGIIAEYKRRSPSRGVINEKVNVKELAAAYASHGASGISVLTDGPNFGGTLDDLVNARENKVPLLRKDFMIDEYQIIESKAYGADVILLIAACLEVSQVKTLARVAKDLGLEVLLEIHNENELEHICDDVDLVGVNNRNLKTFDVDIQRSLDLINKIPSTKPAIAESGISDVQTIVSLKQAGFKGFLIGENFMKHADPAIAFAEFVKQLKANAPPPGRVRRGS